MLVPYTVFRPYREEEIHLNPTALCRQRSGFQFVVEVHACCTVYSYIISYRVFHMYNCTNSLLQRKQETVGKSLVRLLLPDLNFTWRSLSFYLRNC